jgi:hypothetical protein
MNSVASAVMSRMPARFSQKPACIICGSRTSPVPTAPAGASPNPAQDG